MDLITCFKKENLKISDCEEHDNPQFLILLFYFFPSLTLSGILLNLLSLFIFTFSNNMNTKFLRYLKWYLVNSVTVGLNTFIFTLLVSITDGRGKVTDKHVQFFVSNYDVLFYILYIFTPIWTISYTYGNFLDIIISYERILMYLPRIIFMRNMKVYTFLLIILFLSILVNTSNIFSLSIYSSTLTFNSTKSSVEVYFLENSRFNYQNLFNVFFYFNSFLRDIVTFIVELGITVFLVITIVKFYDKKKKVLSGDDQNSDPIIFRKTDMNNSKITLYICVVCSLYHIAIFVNVSLRFFNANSYFLYTFVSIEYMLQLRHSLNFFVFIKLNKKFKRNFLRLLPESLKFKQKSRSNRVAPITSQRFQANNQTNRPTVEIFTISQLESSPYHYINNQRRKRYQGDKPNSNDSNEPVEIELFDRRNKKIIDITNTIEMTYL